MPSDLWTFASQCYARPGVEAACLRLQAAGADVCLLLCGLWLEQRSIPCSGERLEQLQQVASPWQSQVVQPLRWLRQEWRQDAEQDAALANLRSQIKALELQAEQELLGRLEARAMAWPEVCREGPPVWLEGIAGAATATCRDTLQTLRAAAGQA